MKTRVAVLFGGRSPEHDVSIVTGLQALEALDQQRFDAFPVYIAMDGGWWVGDALRRRETYIPAGSKALEPVALEIGANPDGRGRLVPKRSGGFLSRPKPVDFDVALLALHGLSGEDGRLQGLLDVANVPYTGMRPLAASVLMDKAATKRILAGLGIPLLPSVVVERPAEGLMPSAAELERALAAETIAFPVIVKPVHLGSSIGVARAATVAELRAALPIIFRLDTQAIIEPCVENLVEYNVAVMARAGEIRTSAIEMPKRVEELLDFKTKYLSGRKGKAGAKAPGASSQGMLSLTRDINPELPHGIETDLRRWAATCFSAVYGSGVPRIDFLSNRSTGEIWFNEVNPCPGSFGYFLWEAAANPILFSDLLTHLIEEARRLHKLMQLPDDPTNPDARLFPRERT